jgi:hypothetical protein
MAHFPLKGEIAGPKGVGSLQLMMHDVLERSGHRHHSRTRSVGPDPTGSRTRDTGVRFLDTDPVRK